MSAIGLCCGQELSGMDQEWSGKNFLEKIAGQLLAIAVQKTFYVAMIVVRYADLFVCGQQLP